MGRLRWLLLPAGVLGLVAWLAVFPAEDRFDWPDVAMETAYLAAAAAAYAFVVRLRQPLLEVAWIAFMASLLMEVADEFTVEPRFWSEQVTGGLTIGGLVLAAIGFAAAGQRRQRDEAQRLAADAALRAARDEAVSSNAALREAVQSRDELLSIVAHDFSSPLTVILSYAQLLEERAQDDEARRMLGLVATQARHLSGLARNTLLLSRIEAGRLPLRREPLRLGSVLRPLAEAYSGAGRPHIALQVPAEEPLLDADPSRLRQVFENLLGNAIKHAPEASTVEMGLRAADGGVAAWVADQGPGIAAEKAPLLFQRFSRLEERSEHGVAGSGLGLYICRSIVEAHGGRIALDPQHSPGARFEVWLPAAQPLTGSA